MINLLIISLLIIIFIDKSDIVNTLKKVFEFILTIFNCKKLLNVWTVAGKPFKPFECCFCMISWVTIFYYLFIECNIYILLYGVGLAYFADVISELLDVIKGAIQKIITNIEQKLC